MAKGWLVSYPDGPPVIFNDEKFDNEAAAKALTKEDPAGKAIARPLGGAAAYPLVLTPATQKFVKDHCGF